MFFIYTLWGGAGKARRGYGGKGLDFRKRKRMAKILYSLTLIGERISGRFRKERGKQGRGEAILR